VEYEDNDWMAAFNLTLSVAGMYELLFNWFVDTDSSSQLGVVYHGHTQDTTTSSGSGSSTYGSFTVVRRVEDGYEPTGLQVDDRRELYFNSSEPIVMEADASATLAGTLLCMFRLFAFSNLSLYSGFLYGNILDRTFPTICYRILIFYHSLLHFMQVLPPRKLHLPFTTSTAYGKCFSRWPSAVSNGKHASVLLLA